MLKINESDKNATHTPQNGRYPTKHLHKSHWHLGPGHLDIKSLKRFISDADLTSLEREFHSFGP